MDLLSAMPPEIIERIAEMVPVEDLEELAMVSSYIRQALGKLLQPHRKRIAEYSVLDCNGHTGEMREGVLDGPLPILLQKILVDPIIGHYVRRVEWSGKLAKGHSVAPEHKKGLRQRRRAQTDMTPHDVVCENFIAALETPVSPHKLLDFKDAEEEESYYDEIYMGNEEVVLVILLHFLPNLTTLVGTWTPTLRAYFRRLLPFPHKHSAKKKLFQKLRSVTSYGFCTLGGDSIDQFCTVPSVKSIKAHQVYGFRSPRGGHLGRKFSGLTSLTLPQYHSTSRNVCQYLQNYSNLQSFALSVNDKNGFEPFLIRTKLLHRARSSLQKLTVLGPGFRTERHFMGSLKEFEVLQEIYMDWAGLLPNISLSVSCPPGSQTTKGVDHLLPHSLRTLKLRDLEGHSLTCWAKLFTDLKSAKLLSLQLLETIEFVVPQMDEDEQSYSETKICELQDGRTQDLRRLGIVVKFSEW